MIQINAEWLRFKVSHFVLLTSLSCKKSLFENEARLVDCLRHSIEYRYVLTSE